MLDGVEGALPALGGIERLPVGVLDGHIEQSQHGLTTASPKIFWRSCFCSWATCL